MRFIKYGVIISFLTLFSNFAMAETFLQLLEWSGDLAQFSAAESKATLPVTSLNGTTCASKSNAASVEITFNSTVSAAYLKLVQQHTQIFGNTASPALPLYSVATLVASKTCYGIDIIQE